MSIRKPLLVCVVGIAVLVSSGFASAAVSRKPDTDALNRILEDIRTSEYRFSRLEDGSYVAPNRSLNVHSFIGSEGLRVVPRTGDAWEFGMTLVGFGRGGTLAERGQVQLSTAGAGERLNLVSVGLTEWYVNDAKGLEQGFTLDRRPDGPEARPLVVELQLNGTTRGELTPDADTVVFRAASGVTALRYGGLFAEDSAGTEIPARLELQGQRLRIVVDDRDAVYPLVIDPLITVPDWTVEGDQLNSLFGITVALGDFDGNGFDDIAVGAENFDSPEINEGKVFVYMTTPAGPVTGANWTGESDELAANYGSALAVGDWNQDGREDLAIGCRDFDGTVMDGGAVFVYYGSGTGLDNLGARPSGSPTNANWKAFGDQGGMLRSFFGGAVGNAGDVNGDTVDDIIIGAFDYTFDESFEGAAFVWYGAAVTGFGPNGVPGNADWVEQGNDVRASFGASVGGADVNGDNISDVIVGARNHEEFFEAEGRVYVYRGFSGTGPSHTPLWTRDGGINDGRFGVRVRSAGDVNGDNRDDVLIGADDFSNGQSQEGRAFVFNGVQSGPLSQTAEWTAEPDQTISFFGYWVASGDVNGDGFSDVVVGADAFDNTELDEGAVFVYLGSSVGLSRTPSTTLEVDNIGAQFGTAVETGDVNGDGFADILVGADKYTKDILEEGAAFLFYGCEDGDRDGVCTDGDRSGTAGDAPCTGGAQVGCDDNCPSVANEPQADADGDGSGDACDACADSDFDGVCDFPRVLVESAGPGEEVLVQKGTPIKYRGNEPFNAELGLTWTTQGYSDASWANGSYGAGYENNLPGASLLLNSTLPNSDTLFYHSIYTRAQFLIDDVNEVETMFLAVDYDDGYIAWINGVEVYRSGQMPAGTPSWDTLATSGHESSNSLTGEPNYGVRQNISFAGISALQNGINVLAIGAWNDNPNSSDLVLVPRLSINLPTSSDMSYLANSTDPGATTESDWATRLFDDTSWDSGNYGVGFETAVGGDADDLINNEVDPSVRSVYTRARFNVSLPTILGLFLGADYDDAFVAYINGTEVYRSPEMPAGTPVWNTVATIEHESSNGSTPDYGTLIDLTSDVTLLTEGENVLAVGVWRSDAGAGAEDMVVVPKLSINELGLDNCPAIPNPDQSNIDGDEFGDVCDDDIDGDTFLNGVDNCPLDFNNPQTDSDGDAVGDACDLCPMDFDNDIDGDTICGDVDNCPAVANTNQADLDNDLIGDVCDDDIDGDTVDNPLDNCPLTANTPQTNSDGDQNGDVCDCSDFDNQVWADPTSVADLGLTQQFDLCEAKACTVGLNPCTFDFECVAGGGDVCRGTCSLSSPTTCAFDTDCTDPDTTQLTWSPPTEPGGAAPLYDTLRSSDPTGFATVATCIEGAEPDTMTSDTNSPGPGGADYFLIRVGNSCPGGMPNMGKDSSNNDRTGVACP